MKSIAKRIPILLICVALLVGACDPGYSGKAYVENNTAHTLRLSYYINDTDITVIDIAPNTSLGIRNFGGVKSGKQFGCCPCEFMAPILHPADSSKTLNKNINDPDQWALDNPNKSVLSDKEIRCTFIVTEADIQ